MVTDFGGETLGQFALHEEVGRGGMATVYRATQASIGREVAVKVLPAQFLQDDTFLHRFTQEVKLIADLQHPRILPVYDFGQHEGSPYIVMAYMAGGTLEDRIEQGPMLLDDVVRFVGQMAEGLDHAHQRGIIHRDFKPSNVLLDLSDNVHLADFGIAKVSESTVEITGTGMVVGTPGYMAPEMAQTGEVTPAVDVYALGVTLFEMLTGRLPFEAETPIQVLMAHVNDPVPDVRGQRREMSLGIQAVVEKALAKTRAERFASAGAVAAALSAAAGAALDEVDRTMPMTTPPEPSPVTMASTVIEDDPAPSPQLEATVLEDDPQPISAAREATFIESDPQMEPVSVPAPPQAPYSAPPPPRRRLSRAWLVVLGFAGTLVVGLVLVALVAVAGRLSSGERPGDQASIATLPPTPLPTEPASSEVPVEPETGVEEPPDQVEQQPPGEELSGKIVFTRNAGGSSVDANEIYVLQLPGKSVTRLTSNQVADWIPHWSPDGQSIVFTSYQTGNFDIWVMQADGSGQASRIALPAWDDYPAWSPDGSQFAFSTTDFTGGVGNSEIFVGSGSGDVRRLTFNTGRDEWPSWSPDGQRLVDTSDRDGDMEIYIFAASGGEAIQLTDDPGYDEQPEWSPDGEWIAFVRKTQDTSGDGVFTQEDDNGYGDIWIGRPDGSDFRQVTFLHNAAHPAWSPDGAHLVYARFRDLNANGIVDPDDTSDLWVAPVSGGDPFALLESSERDWAPDWTAP